MLGPKSPQNEILTEPGTKERKKKRKKERKKERKKVKAKWKSLFKTLWSSDLVRFSFLVLWFFTFKTFVLVFANAVYLIYFLTFFQLQIQAFN